MGRLPHLDFATTKFLGHKHAYRLTPCRACSYNSSVMNTSEKPAVTLRTLGCKLNQAETEQLACRFARAGWRVTDGDRADVCIINTCTVTHIADRKSRHLIRMLKKQNPQGRVIATGCYAQRAPEALLKAGADFAAGNAEKEHLAEQVCADFIAGSTSCNSAASLDGSGRVRSFIKIQDGCSNFCSYCIVPYVRGRESCLARDDIVARIRDRVEAGYREVVLTGTRIGTYSHEGLDLADLVNRILSTTAIERLHLSSLEPDDVTDGLLDVCKSECVCRHFHLALQHGSDSVLARMNRRYTTAEYERAVERIRNILPSAAITTDIMAGFPGESEDEFKESLDFCRRMDFAALHVFPYSPRPGTGAAAMPHQVSEPLKKERSRTMLELARKSKQRFERKFAATQLSVLWENEEEQGSGLYSGLSDNYLRVYTRSRQNLTNRILPVLTRLEKGKLWGELPV